MSQVTIDPRYLSYDKDEVQALLDAVPGKYVKPQTGIPSTDLSEEVNDALTAGSEAMRFEANNDPSSLFDDDSSE